MVDQIARPKVMIVGPVPPPEFGVAEATRLMLESSLLRETFDLVHLDTSDHRETSNIGHFDWRNVYLACRHALHMIGLLARHRPAVTMLTASQGKLGLLRDILLVWNARLFRSKVATYLRGSGYAQTRSNEGMLAAQILRSILKHSATILVLGNGLVDMARTVDPGCRVSVVPNGCPPAVPEERIGVKDPSHPIIAYVGKLSRGKGIDDLLASASLLVERRNDAEFVLAGDWESPSYRDEIVERIRDSPLAHAVSLPGRTYGASKVDLLARAWVLAVPSHSEGQPWVILEAMSAGIPVVATDTGAVSETIEDGVSGFVVPVGDTAAMADRLASLIIQDDLWSEMSRNAFSRYQEQFTVAKSHLSLAHVLLQMVDTGR